MMEQQTCISDFGESHNLLLRLDKDDFQINDSGLSYQGNHFRPKDEVHITLIGSALAEGITRKIEEDTEVKEKIVNLIEEIDWQYITREAFYHLAKKKEKLDDEGNLRIVHAESIIQMVDVPQREFFYQKLEGILGEKLSHPPMHVTLYTLGDDRGIGIPDSSAFGMYVEQEVKPDELQNDKNLEVQDVFGNVYLIKKESENFSDSLKKKFPDKKICVCDFYISGAEKGKVDNDGINYFDDFLVIDHHANVAVFKKKITSTEIACRYVEQNKHLGNDYVILVNHTDTDSILSAFIMNGKLKPLDRYVDAAIAADHTGDENLISDVLQSLEDDRRIEVSISTLKKVLGKRIETRNAIKKFVVEKNKPNFELLGEIAYIIVDEKIDAGLVPPLLPNATVILIASPMPKANKGKWRIRIRLGSQAKGIALNELDLPDFGGRWNAGSTSRHGGTNYTPLEYVKILKEKLDALPL